LLNTDLGFVPEVVSDVVTWRGRPATLYASAHRPDGSVSSAVALMAGFLGSTPVVDATQVDVEIVPLTAVLDTGPDGSGGILEQLGGVRLAEGVHYWSEYVAWTWCCDVFKPIGFWDEWRAAGAGASGAGWYDLSAPGVWENFRRWYDPVGLAGVADPRCPRIGRLIAFESFNTAVCEFEQVIGGSAAAGAEEVQIGGTYSALDSMPGYTLADAATGESYVVELLAAVGAPGVYAWPQVLQEALAARAPGTVDGVDGALVDVLLGGSGFVLSPNYTTLVPPNLSRTTPGDIYAVAYGSTDPGITRRRYDTTGERRQPPNSSHVIWSPFRFPSDDGSEYSSVGRAAVGVSAKFWPCAVACGWYQSPEPYMLVTGGISVPAGGETPIRIEYYDPSAPDDVRVTRTIATSATPVVKDGNTYTRLQLKAGAYPMSFASWPGLPAARLYTEARWDGARAGQVLLELLESGAGGANGAYDVQPWGANVPAALIDEDSFLRLTPPAGFDSWSFTVDPEKSLRETIEPILLASSSQLTLRRLTDGTCRLSVVSVGPEVASLSRFAIGAGDWVADGRPRDDRDDEIYNAYSFTVDHDSDGENGREIKVYDFGSISELGQEARRLDLNLVGVRVPPTDGDEATALYALYSALFARFGRTRRVWTGSIHTHHALLLSPGDVVTVTSPDLHGYTPAPGVTAASARLTSLEIPLWSDCPPDAQIRAVYYGSRGTGVNAALVVDTVIDATTVDVLEDELTGGTDATGAPLLDADLWAAGDAVSCVPRCDQDSRSDTTITAITSVGGGLYRVVLGAAHGLAAGDYLEPRVYDSAEAVHTALAYLSDGAGTLGAAASAGFTFA